MESKLLQEQPEPLIIELKLTFAEALGLYDILETLPLYINKDRLRAGLMSHLASALKDKNGE
jgi:hypothetical protein